MITKDELIAFETDIASCFENGMIRAPVHLSKGNEEELIRIFRQVGPEHWVFSTHRSHYHALLKGVPAGWLKQEIMEGRSITLNCRAHRFFSSAIVGGILPIAMGVAMTGDTAWCFVGDMAAETGIFHECVKYARGHNLPVRFVVEDNGYSVETPTDGVWHGIIDGRLPRYTALNECVYHYSYHSKYPHQGMGKHVIF